MSNSGSARCRFARELWIERDDFQEQPPKGYFRLAPGAEVRLRYAFIVKCTGVEKDAAGNVTRRPLHLRPGDAQRHAGRRFAQGQGQHPLAVGGDAVPAEVRLYDRLFRVPFPGARLTSWPARSPARRLPAACAGRRR